ncbi:hypothetical protein MKX08_004916 [Trichoderma sp. CBMAI-0020]|nr:hypothetical protein MKX08_004916 [Trichoderma sp. CBMAI-0020]
MADKTPTKRPEPTASEAMFFFAIVKHTRNRADIDWDAVAQEQGFKNAEVAKVRFGQVKRKLGIDSNVTPKKGSNASPSSASTPSKVRKTPTGRAGTKGRARGSRAKKENDDAAAADAEAGDDTTTAVESPSAKGEEDDSINFKAEHGEDPF